MNGLADRLWFEVRALNLPHHDYVIFGSGPLVAHGLIDHVRDIDIVARGEAWEKASSLAPPVLAPHGDRVIHLRGGDIEIFDGFFNFDAHQLINAAMLIEGLPFGCLSHVLRYKELLGRDKDLEHIRIIEAYLRTCT
jgi:hypothetical protein